MSHSLDHECIHVPITALACYSQYLFVGEGPFLRICDNDPASTANATILATERVFESQAIHGIAVDSSSEINGVNLVVWGGTVLRLVRVDLSSLHAINRPVFTYGQIIELPDWILDLAIRPPSHCGSDEEGQIALITAHNKLFILGCSNLFQGSTEVARHIITTAELTETSRCILYAAHLQWISDTCIIIAAGTAFGEILVWTSNLGNSTSRANLHHIFTGHEGSIFDVRVSHPLRLPGENKDIRLLSSCSDDRSIRIWRVSIGAEGDESEISDKSLDLLRERETGFGANQNGHEDAEQQCLAVAWGHSSRIWSVNYMAVPESVGDSRTIFQILSTGEDATSQVWDLVLKINTEPTKDNLKEYELLLKNNSSVFYHTGKNIWSYNISGSTDLSHTIITGAADSSIVRYQIPSQVTEGTWTCEEVLKCLDKIDDTNLAKKQGTSHVSFSGGKSGDSFRTYGFINEETIVIATTHGKVLMLDLMKGCSSPNGESGSLQDQAEIAYLDGWSELGQFDDLKGYSVATGLPSRNLAFLGTSTGTVYMISGPGSIAPLVKLDGKVSHLFADIAGHGGDGELIILTATRVGASHADIIVLSQSEEPAGEALKIIHRVQLSLPSRFITTCATISPSPQIFGEIFLGSRTGSIVSYTIPQFALDQGSGSVQEGEELEKIVLSPTSFTEKVHVNEAVTAMLWLQNDTNIPSTTAFDSATDRSTPGYLLSVGRDGTCVVQELPLESSTQVHAKIVHKAPLPFGPLVEGVYIEQSSGAILAYGFKSKHFVLINLNTEQELMSVDCGGAHRAWAFARPRPRLGSRDTNNHSVTSRTTFVWTQASRLRASSARGPSHTRIKSGGHGREIKAIAASPYLASSISSLDYQLVATGAEDTDIKIFRYDNCLKAPRGEGGGGGGSNSLQCLRTLRRHRTGIQHLQWSKDGKFLFSSGGCEEFYVWRVRTLPVFGVGVVCEATCQPESELADLRIMSFEARECRSEEQEGERAILIAMVFSDSTLRLYNYFTWTGQSHPRFDLLFTGTYNTSCLTQCIFPAHVSLPVQNSINGDSYVPTITSSALQTITTTNTTTTTTPLMITGSTDGHIALWRPASDPTTTSFYHRSKVHQSSIKTLCQHRLSEHALLLLTGGDDNAFGITLVYNLPPPPVSSPPPVLSATTKETLETPPPPPPPSTSPQPTVTTLVVPRAHASAITSVAVLVPTATETATTTTATSNSSVTSNGNEILLRAVTSGNDQRVKMWELSIDVSKPGVEGVGVRKVTDVSTAVADVAGLEVLEGGRVLLVAGVGMEAWRAI